MRYKNIKTGAVIETECVINGENWKKERARGKNNDMKENMTKTEMTSQDYDEE